LLFLLRTSAIQASLMALGLASVQASLTLLSFFHGFSWLYCWGRRLSVVSGKEWLCLHKQGLLEAYRRMLAGSMQYKQGFCRFWFMLTQEFTGDPKKPLEVKSISFYLYYLCGNN
jgi:hypothetical protein